MTLLQDPGALLAIFCAIALGSILKGATGAGTPVVAVPVIAAFYDVRLGVAIMSIVNLASNAVQLRQFRSDMIDKRFTWTLMIGAGVGTVFGSLLLAWLPDSALSLLIAGAVFCYITLRLLSPDFRLEREQAYRMAGPVSVMGGMMQGATGISAPVSVSFLNAMKLERGAFVFTISAFFTGMAVVQVPSLMVLGILTWESTLLGLVALIPMWIFMGVGEALAKKLSPQAFDKIILLFLFALAIRLIQTALFPAS